MAACGRLGAVIFAFSSVPSLGTGLGTWDLILRKCAHITEYAILGFLLMRAFGRPAPALALGALYAASDEVHQHFVRGRHGAWYDVVIDTVGVTAACWCGGAHAGRRSDQAPASTSTAPSETRGRCGSTGSRTRRRVLDLDPDVLPADRGAAAAALDASGAGNWRTLLERFAEDRAPVYLRPSAEASAALRRLQANGARIGVYTDAPVELARVALAQLGAARRVEAVEAGAGALQRLRDVLGPDAVLIGTRDELTAISS